jgi:dTMP kinase
MKKSIRSGKLYVFEGPDGVGKTTLAQSFATYLQDQNELCEYLSFPGRETGTLGKHIYELHHDPGRFGIGQITATSIQALHIAAHLDIVERRILPALRRGQSIVLDRYWWSTWVYGVVYGAPPPVLKALIMAEVEQWEGVLPAVVLLISTDAPLKAGTPLDDWKRLCTVYDELAAEEQIRYPVKSIANDSSIDLAIKQLIKVTSLYTGG